MADDERPPKEQGTTEEIRKQVEERIHQEMMEYPDASKNNGKVTSAFVDQCLFANELGDGLLYAALMKDKFIFNNTTREWLAWSGHHWDRDIMEEALAATETVVETLLEETRRVSKVIEWNSKKGSKEKVEEGQDLQERIFKRVSRLRTDKGRNACLKFARTNRDPLSIRGDEFDINPWLLVCGNGVIDLRTGKFRDGRPDEYMFLASPTEWKGLDEPAEAWEKFLLEIMDGQEDLVAYLFRLLGYGITGLNIEHILPVFWGAGRNGKGKMVEIINHVMGPLSGSIQSEMLLDQKISRSSQGPSSDILTLKGLRFAFASETDEGQKFSAARVKWLTGGDQLVGRYPYDKYEIRFTPTHTLFLLTNHKPYAPADDFAFWERVHLLPFHLSFVDREPRELNERRANKYIAEKLKQERSGILAWLVRGCLEYQKKGLDPPKAILEATAEYRRDEDLLADFLDDYCIQGHGIKGQASELYDKFSLWYRANVSKKGVFSQRKFGAYLSKRFEKKKNMGVIYYIGVDLDPNASPIDGEGGTGEDQK